MIDMLNAKKEFNRFLEKYQNQKETGFELKITHTYHVVEFAKSLAKDLDLDDEDVILAELIGLLHDIGRFEELNVLKKFDNISFNHASYGVKMLFDDNMIRNFVKDDKYDNIIKVAINNHSRLRIEDNLDDKTLLHSKIIRDADKLDNFRVKSEEKVETIFPGLMKNKDELETSTITNKVYETIMSGKCVDVHDRKTILDYWVCVLAFVYDLNFKASYKIIKDNDYINKLIDRFCYRDDNVKKEMENIRNKINNYIDDQLK